MKIIDLHEARTTQRRPALEIGLIRFGDISATCVLRNNVSEGGAAFDIGSQVGIPDQFVQRHLAEGASHGGSIYRPQRKPPSVNRRPHLLACGRTQTRGFAPSDDG
jgi:hypothetical protein